MQKRLTLFLRLQRLQKGVTMQKRLTLLDCKDYYRKKFNWEDWIVATRVISELLKYPFSLFFIDEKLKLRQGEFFKEEVRSFTRKGMFSLAT